MSRPPFRVPSNGSPFLDLFSKGRAGPQECSRFSSAQIEQIRRTVRRAPEVMVKVTDGGRTADAVAAHLAYISHQGELDLGHRPWGAGGRARPEGSIEELAPGTLGGSVSTVARGKDRRRRNQTRPQY